MKHERWKLELTSDLMSLGDSIREKLDKRGWLCDGDTEGQLKYFENGNKIRTENEVIDPMKEFIRIFEKLSKITPGKENSNAT